MYIFVAAVDDAVVIIVVVVVVLVVVVVVVVVIMVVIMVHCRCCFRSELQLRMGHVPLRCSLFFFSPSFLR